MHHAHWVMPVGSCVTTLCQLGNVDSNSPVRYFHRPASIELKMREAGCSFRAESPIPGFGMSGQVAAYFLISAAGMGMNGLVVVTLYDCGDL